MDKNPYQRWMLEIRDQLYNKLSLYVREVFDLRLSELTYLLNDYDTEADKLIRLKQLSVIANAFRQAEIERLDSFIRRSCLDGHDLLYHLKENPNVTDYIPILKKLSDKESVKRKESKGSGRHLQDLDNII